MSYYSYGKEELLKSDKIKIRVLGERGEVLTQFALDMLEIIERNNAAGEKTVFIVPVGPVDHYPIFVRMVNEREISLKNVWFINMDEYLTDSLTYIDQSDSLSFRGFMERTVYSKISPQLVMPAEQRIFPDPAAPQKIAELIERLGGVSACFGGIGINGHIAFNEPENVLPEEFAARETRTGNVTRETLAVNCIDDKAGAIDEMPHKFVTVGMRQILGAKIIRLYCLKPWHNAVCHRAAFGERSASFPVTLLQNHQNVSITIPEYLARPSF